MPNILTATNSYRHYNLPIVNPYIAFFGENWTLNRQNPAAPHFHNCVELGLCHSGSGTVYVEDQIFPFQAGDCCFIPENTAHKSQASSSSSNWEYIYFDPCLLLNDILPKDALDCVIRKMNSHFGVITEIQHPELHFIIRRIFDELHNKEIHYQESIKGLFLSLIMFLTRDSQLEHSVNSDFQWLYSALNYICENYYRKLSIAEIALKCCNMSESHFRRKFRETMHINPLDYINHFRIRVACKAIYKNEKSINEIADDVGFPTLSSFNRNFQALMGCSPSQWKRNQSSENTVIEIWSLDEQAIQGVFVI